MKIVILLLLIWLISFARCLCLDERDLLMSFIISCIITIIVFIISYIVAWVTIFFDEY